MAWAPALDCSLGGGGAYVRTAVCTAGACCRNPFAPRPTQAARALASGAADIAIHWGGGMHHGHPNKAYGFCYVNDLVGATPTYPPSTYAWIHWHLRDGLPARRCTVLSLLAGAGGADLRVPPVNAWFSPCRPFAMHLPLSMSM